VRRSILAIVALFGLTACASATDKVLVPAVLYPQPVYVITAPVVVEKPVEKASEKKVEKEASCAKGAACCQKAVQLYELVPARKPLLNLNLRRPQYYLLSN